MRNAFNTLVYCILVMLYRLKHNAIVVEINYISVRKRSLCRRFPAAPTKYRVTHILSSQSQKVMQVYEEFILKQLKMDIESVVYKKLLRWGPARLAFWSSPDHISLLVNFSIQ